MAEHFRSAAGETAGNRPWFVLDRAVGRVVAVDGSRPPKGVQLQALCGGRSYDPLTLSDPTGNFEFGPQHHAHLIASLRGDPPNKSLSEVGLSIRNGVRVPLNFQPELLPLCYVTAQLDGQRAGRAVVGRLAADDVTIVSRRSRADVGIIVLRPIEMLTGKPASQTTALAPDAARKSYGKAIGALNRRFPDYDRAVRRLEAAVEAHPAFAAAWDLLGDVRLGIGDRGGALQAWSRAINADPAYLPPYVQLMATVVANRNWTELAWLAERFLETSPDAPLALYMSAVAAVMLEDLPLLEARTTRLLQAGELGNWPNGRLLRAVMHESKSELKPARKLYELLLQSDIDEGLDRFINARLQALTKLQGGESPSSGSGTGPSGPDGSPGRASDGGLPGPARSQ